MVNQLAVASLPTNFPAFVRIPAAIERIAFLGGEADRWRNTPDVALQHCNEPDHYIDFEELTPYGLEPKTLPVFRYDFISHLAVVRKAHPDRFPAVDPAFNKAHVRELVGLLPWAITENYGKLKSGFSYLKAYEEDGGTPEEIANAQQNILYIMGVMGHYVGDASQPLHTTIHHHGWVGPNPNGYTTNRTFHSWIDGGYFRKVRGLSFLELQKKLRPATLVSLGGQPARPEEIFQASVIFIEEAFKLLEPLYRLEKEGKLSGDGELGRQGKAFLETQIIKSGQMLGDIFYSAWQHAPPDRYLKDQLAKRRNNRS